MCFFQHLPVLHGFYQYLTIVDLQTDQITNLKTQLSDLFTH
jgi:hypothetical protein